jgi:methyltransferase (TIGR00027 family)
MERQVPGIRGGLLCRKRYIDEKLLEALDCGTEVVVILGVGMDTRACRIPALAARRVYEVDLPEVVAAKQAVIKRLYGLVPSHFHWASIDFDRQDLGIALQGAGYSPASPGFFIWEGVA